MKSVIYALIHPITREPRYCGGTVQPIKNRLRVHIYDSSTRKYDHHTACWIKSLLNQGLSPEIIVIQELDIEYYFLVEMLWIWWFRRMGIRLTNSTVGGEGTLGYKCSEESRQKRRNRRHSNATKIKQSLAHKGVPKSEEHKKNLSIALTGKTHTPAQIEANRQSHLGITKTPESIAKTIATKKANGTNRHSQETREKLRLAKLGKGNSDESKEKNRVASTGRKHTPETIEKLRQINLGKKYPNREGTKPPDPQFPNQGGRLGGRTASEVFAENAVIRQDT